MNRKISVGMAVTIVILAMTVTFSITMLIAMRLFDSTVSSVKEKESLYGDAKADTVKPFLEVLDNLERGLSQFEEGDPHRQGMEMICRQFMTVLEKLGVQQIEALGQPFDPARHNAVMHVEEESAGENTVVEEFQQGYAMDDKVLRFAMVKVAN